MPIDLLMNGQAHGGVATALLENNMDYRQLQPWQEFGKSWVMSQNAKGVYEPSLSRNATATLRRDQWKAVDEAIVRAARSRLRFVADLRSAGLTYTIPNGMGKTVLETERMNDPGNAAISMDGMRETTGDRPLFDILTLPLPIIHMDFFFSARQIAVSRGGSPLDMTMVEVAGRRVAETVEAMALGVAPAASYAYGVSGTIYGISNHPNVNTKSMTLPTASGWTPAVAVNEVLEMKLQLSQDKHFGPYRLYCSLAWDPYLDDDYSSQKGDLTLRQRLAQIEGIQSVTTVDYLDTAGTVYKMILVQMSQDVVRMIEGMPLTTVQWESQGGMKVHFKVMTIAVPQVRADINLNCGIVVGTAA